MKEKMQETLLIKARREWLYKIIFSVILYTITFSVVFRLAGIRSDYSIHISWSEQIHRDNITMSSQARYYPMWHLLVRVCYKIFAMPMEYAAAVVSAVVNVFVYLIVAGIVKKYGVDKSEMISFCLMLVGPLYAPWFNSRYYLGQYTPNIWHNPTNLMVKPFAVICFFLIIGVLADIQNGKRVKRAHWIILTGLIFLSVLAKPSFVQGIIPGLGLYLILFCIKNRFRDIKQYICLCLTFVPGVLWLLYQMLGLWGAEGVKGGTIAIGWLKVASHYSPNVWISLLLSLGFPLLYIVFNWEKTVKRTDVQLSICCFAMAWLQSALLYETVGTYQGNFDWASYIAIFMLWAVIVICFCKDIQNFKIDNKLEAAKNTVLMSAFLIHLLCGCWYAYSMIVQPNMKY